MSEATVKLEIPMRIFDVLQQLASTQHSDPVSVLEQMLDTYQGQQPANDFANFLLQAPTLTKEEVAKYERIREWM